MVIDIARFSVLVRKGAGKVLFLPRDESPVQASPIASDEQTVALDQQVGTGGYVRTRLRDELGVGPVNPAPGRGPMEALTSPIFLVEGSQSEGNALWSAPPPPASTQEGAT